ncbi:MAG: flagellar biosynthesis protein FlhB [Desulfobacteraceae bacterium]
MAEDPEGGGEKTEDASSRKLEKAREEGQVAKSMEVPAVFVLLGGILSLYMFSAFVYEALASVSRYSFVFEEVPELTKLRIKEFLAVGLREMFFACLPAFAAVYLMALVSNFAQVGFAVSWKAMQPKISKLNPITGFKDKFSSRALVEFVKSLLKIGIISVVVHLSITGDLERISRLYDRSPGHILIFILQSLFWIFLKVCLIMLIVAVIDYAYQKWKFLQDQKMTKKEVKDETKQTEGDPQVKSRIKQLQTEAARKRMMAEVPEADVVVTNPTRLAVALKYDSDSMDAPGVVAKGSGPVAENIRRIAGEHNVPVIEDKPLARNLYRQVDIGGEVPSEFYQAVAELLAYVYKLGGKKL